MKLWKKTSGFTLVELIVVLVIIGIFSTVAVVVGRNMIAKGRDGKRFEDMKTAWELIKIEKNENGDFPNGIEETKAIFDADNRKLASGMADICYFIAASEGTRPEEDDDDFAIATWGETTSTKEEGTPGVIVFGTAQAIANLSEAELGSGPMQLTGYDFNCENPDGFGKIYDIFTGS